MKKNFIIFFLSIFLLFKTAQAHANETPPYCGDKINQDILRNLDNLKIKKIDVKLNNYKRWTENSIRILIGNFRWIPEKYKRRFGAKIIVKFDNDLQCSFDARVRHNGDQKDHISLKGNSIIQSVDVHLKNGHIYGITKFKLLRPNTRGNMEDEIFLTELLRELDYIAPRTIYVSASINGVDSKMIFQEKAAKELLEYNKRREGPIFEGDERFIFRLSKDLPSNNLSNLAVGMMPLLEKGVNAGLAKQTNSKLINKSDIHSEMSFNSLSNLNLTYLLYSNMYKNKKNNFYYSNYNLNNNLLAFGNSENVLKLDIYNLIIFAANAWHGLVPNNRKFYWNSIENYFEPINYDSNPDIELEQNVFHLPASSQISLAFDQLEKSFQNINSKKLSQNLNFRGLDLNEKQVNNKIKTISRNLQNIKLQYLNTDPDTLSYNHNAQIKKEMWDKYYSSLYEINPDIYLVKQPSNENKFQRCEIKSAKCINYSLYQEQVSDLLEGELIKDNIEYQYLGKTADSLNLIDYSNYKKVKFQDSFFYFDDGIKYNFYKEKNELIIYQLKPGSRAFFLNGSIKNLKIKFFGKDEKLLNVPNYPIDLRGLTGCLSLVNLKVEDVSLEAGNSSCEDAVNLINVKGNFDEVIIIDSFMDALDIDFSEVEIKNINVKSASNDCVDLSAGNYNLKKLRLYKCGDKALSVGEKSILHLEEIIVEKAKIGIASKDSSEVVAKSANIKLKIPSSKCLNSYRKKQEFSGGIINIKQLTCHGSDVLSQNGSFINNSNL